LLFSLLAVFLLARMVKMLPPAFFERYLVRPVKGDPPATEVRCC